MFIQNSSKIETITTISKGCQPLPRVKDKDSSSFLNISLFKAQLKTELISEYGQPTVECAIRKAVKHNKNNFEYIEGICKKYREKAPINKSLEKARQKKMDQYKALTLKQRKSWSYLHHYELACSKTLDNSPLKEIGSG